MARRRSALAPETNVQKKARAARDRLIVRVRQVASNYANVFVLRIVNPRVQFMQALRQSFPDSKIVIGKLRLLEKALSGTQGLSSLKAKNAEGEVNSQLGLLFTNMSRPEAEAIIRRNVFDDYARAGSVASETITLPEGELSGFAMSQESLLRRLGLPTLLKDGKVMLLGTTTVCTEGKKLTVEAAHMVKLLGRKMAKFYAQIVQ